MKLFKDFENDIKNPVFIKKVVAQPRSFKYESVRVISVLIIVLVLTWSISKADEINPFVATVEDAKTSFSVIGIVSSIDDTHIIMTDTRGSDDSGEEEYNINIKDIEKIETNEYQPIALESVKIGDKIIIQGKTTGKVYFAKRLILFPTSPVEILEEIATSTATTTEDITATTTDDIATSTDDGTATSTDDDTATSTDESTETATTTDTESDTSTTTTETSTTTDDTSTTTDDTDDSSEADTTDESNTIDETEEVGDTTDSTESEGVILEDDAIIIVEPASTPEPTTDTSSNSEASPSE